MVDKKSLTQTTQMSLPQAGEGCGQLIFRGLDQNVETPAPRLVGAETRRTALNLPPMVQRPGSAGRTTPAEALTRHSRNQKG